MKHSTRALFLFLVSCILFAQPFGMAAKGYRIDQLKYKNASGEMATTYFFYNDKGLMHKAFWTLDNNERWSINDYTYDDAGNLTAAFRDFSDSLYTHELFFYDQKGRKIKEYFTRSDSISGSASYMYDRGKLLKANYDNHKGWLNGTVVYTYDHGQRSGAELKIHGEVRCTISYSYDISGNLIKEHWDFQGRWDQTFVYEYKRISMKKQYYTSPYFNDLTSCRISGETYTFNDKVGGPSYYHYDEKGRLAEKVFERSDGISTTTFFTYDKNGRLKTSYRNYSDGNKGYFSYTYDTKDRLILREFYMNDTLTAYESHLYDDDGRLTKSYLKNFDGWLNGTLDYETNLKGETVRGIFHGEDGFDADLRFDYDDKGLLTGLLWTFSTGDFQRYAFTYDPVE